MCWILYSMLLGHKDGALSYTSVVMIILYISLCFFDPGISDSDAFQKSWMQMQIERLIWMHSTLYLATQTRNQNTTSSVLQLALVKT